MRAILVVIVMISLTGCGQHMKPIFPERINPVTNFNNGAIQTQFTGGTIYSQIDARVTPGFYAEDDISLPSSAFVNMSKIIKGTKLSAEYEYDNGSLFCRPEYPILNNAALYASNVCLVVEKSGTVRGFVYCHIPHYPTDHDEFKDVHLKNIQIFSKGSVQKELIYNGKSGSTIKLMYREYVDDLARPSFFQDLSYDLSESKMISYKNVTIEIVEATNTVIRFKILKGDLI